MEELYKVGLNEIDIKNMLETNPEIINLAEEELTDQINILKTINCNQKIIKNILISNPFYLTNLKEDMINLINILKRIGLNNLELLFDANPNLLNKDVYEIEEFINNKINHYSLEEIIDMIDNNPFIIDEE